MTLKLALAAGAGALVTGCVSSAPEPPPRARINIFISPAGEPFRAGPDAPYPVDVWFAGADADHDGALSQAEFEADATRFFKTLDANRDGVVDGFEVGDYEQKVAPELLPRVARLTARDIAPLPVETRPGDEPPRAIRRSEPEEPRRNVAMPDGGAAFSLTGEHEPVAAEDADFDGKVTLAEAAAAARRRFALLDKNHDGLLARSELPETAAQRLVARTDRKRPKPRP